MPDQSSDPLVDVDESLLAPVFGCMAQIGSTEGERRTMSYPVQASRAGPHPAQVADMVYRLSQGELQSKEKDVRLRCRTERVAGACRYSNNE